MFLLLTYTVLQESFQWNGTTSKRKGQKWGTEKSTERNDNKVVNGVHSNISSSLKEIKLDHPIDFDKLPSLSCLPKVSFWLY